MIRTSLRARILGSLLAWLPLAAVLAWLIIDAQQLQRAQLERVAYADELGELRRTVMGLLVDAETGQRGYTITGDERFLNPWTIAVERLPRELARLELLTARLERDRPGDREQSMRFAALAELKLRQVAEIIEARRERGFEAARSLVASGDGMVTMDAVRQDSVALLQAVQQWKVENGIALQKNLMRTRDGSLLGIAASVALVLLLGASLSRRIITPLRELAAVATGVANGRLDGRAAVLGDDEIGQLGAALNTMIDCLRDDREARDRARAELARAQETLVDALDVLPDALGIYGPDERLVHSNAAYLELLRGIGTDPAAGPVMPGEAISRAAEMGLVPEASGRVEEWIAERVAAFRSGSYDHAGAEYGGVIYQIRERRMRNGGTVGLYTDITPITRTRRALDDLRLLQTSILDATTDVVIACDPTGCITLLNRAAERAFGLDAAVTVGAVNLAGLIAAEDPDDRSPDRGGDATAAVAVSFAALTAPALREDVVPWEGHLVRVDGSSLPVEMAVSAQRDPAGNVRGFVCVARDITEARAARRRLQESNARLEQRVEERTRDLGEANAYLQEAVDALDTLVQSSPVPIVTLDRTGRVERWNPAAALLSGYAEEQVLGRPPPTIPADQQAAFLARLAPVFAGSTVSDMELAWIRADGVRRDALASWAPLRDGAGVLRGAVGIIIDVTERISMQRQLTQSQKMEAVGQLTGGLAHDFNNLLGIVIGNLDLLADHLREERDAAALVEAALNASLRGAELNRRLLAFARRQPLAPKVVAPATVVQELSQLLKRTLGEHIEIRIRCQDSPWAVLIDATQLESALLNLAVNARDAMPEGGVLSICVTNEHLEAEYCRQNADVRPGEYVCIAVSDTGVGMPADVIARAFEPFFTTKPAGRGTGLGLSMIYGFVKQSSGHIKIYSELGHGTTIKLYLGRGSSAESTELSDATATTTGARGVETVLVVEDNAGLREVVVAQLRDLGYRTEEADSALAALDLLSKGTRADLLLTDIIMPGGMDGVALAGRVEELYPELKVLFTSGFTGAAAEAATATRLAGRLLSKPYRKSDLARMVRACLDA